MADCELQIEVNTLILTLLHNETYKSNSIKENMNMKTLSLCALAATDKKRGHATVIRRKNSNKKGESTIK